ncbi:XRE family transcriptional regulator [Pseudomonas chlororaphis]|nr:XRE family transcriptional regulator [Pseudomonas chlororaphis]MBP5143716.1 XRE family transcriptional regulator [Pseudomonas chlororaphis]QTU04051.1 XRE family transcriptional regulator [Pseudomonas chlororaphis]
MRLRAQSDQFLAATVGARLQTLRLKNNITLEMVAKNAAISRQTLHLLLSQGKGTLINLISVLRAIGELERLSSLVEEVLPSPLQIMRMEGKKRQRASGRRNSSDQAAANRSRKGKSSDW